MNGAWGVLLHIPKPSAMTSQVKHSNEPVEQHVEAKEPTVCCLTASKQSLICRVLCQCLCTSFCAHHIAPAHDPPPFCTA